MNWVLFWLVLHILAAILAFGPTYTFPMIGVMAQKQPQHLVFALRLQEFIATRLVLPLSLTMLVSGVGLIFAAGVDLPKSPYLLVSIALYLIALANALFILLPNGAKLVHMAEQMTGARAMATAGPGAAPAGPPAEFLALIGRQRMAGAINGLLVFVIVFLMVVKPGGLVPGPIFG